MTPLKAVSKWRESTVLAPAERAKHHARRYGFTLEVTLVSGGIAHGPKGDRVVATAGQYVVSAGRFTVLERMEWPVVASDTRGVESTIDVAKQWAETQADKLAGHA
jgi:hypothetical protein